VLLKRPAGSDVVVERLGPGQYFGEVSLVNRSRTIATVRATTAAPVEVLALDGDTFQGLLAESADFRETMENVAHSRLAHRRTVVEG
jgi:CRP-like cAMP-binding protein